MKTATNQIRNNLWDKLTVIYNGYTSQSGQIPTQRVEEIVRDALGETSRCQIDYVIKNMFRLDSNGNGTVSLLQFGNFLFKRHCGQMSLQKMHKANLIKNSSQRKITQQEFWKLVNNAYEFLKEQCPRNACDQIFSEADKDQDGLITYPEYFKFIEKSVCQTQAQFVKYEELTNLGKQWHSMLRRYIWNQLKYLYELEVGELNISLTDQNLKSLISFLLGPLSELQMNFILNGLFQIQSQELEFQSWAPLFIYLVAELHLTRFQANHSTLKKNFTAHEFVNILRNTFKFLKISRVKEEVLLQIFKRIDKDNDGIIYFEEYLNWVRKYLCVEVNKGFYLREDDVDFINESQYLEIEYVPAPIEPTKSNHHIAHKVKFGFSDFDLSKNVRARMYELLLPFDANKDQQFDELQIRNALLHLLKSTQNQIQYVVRNVFRYDRNNDKKVTYDQLTDFFVQQHFGEMAIQRLHKKDTYSRGKDRVMNKAEFALTLNNALSYIHMQATTQQINLIWSQISYDKSEWITYERYFLFLRYYFGSLIGQDEETQDSDDGQEKWKKQMMGMSSLDRFIKWIFDQLQKLFYKYDFNKNLQFESDEIEAILEHIFCLSGNQIQYIMLQFFNFESRNSKSLTFDELVRILLSVYFVDFRLKGFKNQQAKRRSSGKINLEQFLVLIRNSTFFLEIPLQEKDLCAIFKLIDIDNDGWITYNQYIDFILKYIGKNCLPRQNWIETSHLIIKQKPKEISGDQWDFVLAIWDELKAYFDRYDKGKKNFLEFQELKKFIIEVLKENTERQIDYVMWNIFRADPNGDKEIHFHQFAPFILKHAGQISLQRFHRQQILGKKSLTEEELFIVFSNAFCFLKTMPKSHPAVNAIYRRIGKGDNPTYDKYLTWINSALALKYRK